MKQRRQAFLAVIMSLFMLFICNTSAFCQVGINTLDPKSTLDVTAGTGVTDIDGIQAPRLTLAQLAAKGNSLYGANQGGAIIYVTDIAGGGNIGQRVNITIPGYYYFDGVNWQKLNPTQPFARTGDIINSFMPSDHNGWYLLDGRAISGLPVNARAVATGLGFSSNLPDARDRVLRSKASAEALASIGGANTLVIAQTNLPAVPLSGTVSGTLASAGTHTHTVNGSLASAGVHTHTVSGSLVSTGAHWHTYASIMSLGDVDRGAATGSIWNYTSSNTNVSTTTDGVHTHDIDGTLAANTNHTHAINATLAANTNHTHAVNGTTTVPLGGSGTALNNRSAYLVVNTFIYLGQ